MKYPKLSEIADKGVVLNVSPRLPADPGGGRLPPLRRVNMGKIEWTGPHTRAPSIGGLGRWTSADRRWAINQDGPNTFVLYDHYYGTPTEVVTTVDLRSAQEQAEYFVRPNPTTGLTVGPEGREHLHEYERNPGKGDVRSYIRKIKNANKQAYAEAFLGWLQSGAAGAEPERGDLSYMAAQAVRINLIDMTGINPYRDNPTTGLTAKGKRMYSAVKEAGTARAPSAVVYGAAAKGTKGLVTKEFAREHGYPAPNKRVPGWTPPRGKPPGVPNPFMVPEYARGTAWSVETTSGGDIVLSDLVPTEGYVVDEWVHVDNDPKLAERLSPYVEGDVQEMAVVKGWFAHLTAHGYMDQTEWAGPFKSQEEAMKYIEDTYEVDSETGEELE